jgi:hypothetical protein
LWLESRRCAHEHSAEGGGAVWAICDQHGNPVAEQQVTDWKALAGELAEALASIENDDGSIPATIWDMRNAALAKYEQEKGV